MKIQKTPKEAIQEAMQNIVDVFEGRAKLSRQSMELAIGALKDMQGITARNTGSMNNGDRNSGDCNTGNKNSGCHNTGNRNSGEKNSGNANAGNWNHGEKNSGDFNIGNRNSGNRNSGNFNSGYGNDGEENSGDFNTGRKNTGKMNHGDNNSGDKNIGDMNTGDKNIGDKNSGNMNHGNQNTGVMNNGNGNTGIANKCDFSNGIFCNKDDKNIRIFNVPSGMSMKAFYRSKYWKAIKSAPFPLSEWSREEIILDPENGKGKVKPSTMEDAWAAWWSQLSDDMKKTIQEIPNFNPVIFKDITGIDVLFAPRAHKEEKDNGK